MAAIVWWFVFSCAWVQSLTSPPPRSFIVIVADDVGTDKIGVYGESPSAPPTPTLDALAAEGVWFRNAYTTPVCSSSRAMLLTGRYGRRTGVGTEISPSSRAGLPLAEITVPEALDRGGDWSAAALGKWDLTGLGSDQPFTDPLRQGFDRVRGSRRNLHQRTTALDTYQHWQKNVDGLPERCSTYATVDTTDEAIAALRELPEPYFLWVAYNAAHGPHHWPPGVTERGRGRGAPYDAMVTHLDAEIGRLLAAMSPRQRRNTTIVFVGDNGTPREAIRPPFRPAHGKASIHEGGTNVPLIVAGAGVSGRGESAALVSGVDLLPTVLDLARVSADGLVLDGVSFAPLLVDPRSAGARAYVYTEHLVPNGPPPYRQEEYAIRDDRYKLVRLRGGRWAHYDLSGRHDDGAPIAREVARERFEALGVEVRRLRDEVRFDRQNRDPRGE